MYLKCVVWGNLLKCVAWGHQPKVCGLGPSTESVWPGAINLKNEWLQAAYTQLRYMAWGHLFKVCGLGPSTYQVCGLGPSTYQVCSLGPSTYQVCGHGAIYLKNVIWFERHPSTVADPESARGVGVSHILAEKRCVSFTLFQKMHGNAIFSPRRGGRTPGTPYAGSATVVNTKHL